MSRRRSSSAERRRQARRQTETETVVVSEQRADAGSGSKKRKSRGSPVHRGRPIDKVKKTGRRREKRANIEAIRQKQVVPVSTEPIKFKTDQRKYFFLQELSKLLNPILHEQLIGALRGFFVKNAPVGFNDAVSFARPRRSFNTRFDRDNTLRVRRDQGRGVDAVDYHRTVGKHKHFWRILLIRKLNKHFKKQNLPDLSFSSFDVATTDNVDELVMSFLTGYPIQNRRMLSAASDAVVDRIETLSVLDQTLVAWKNSRSDGIAARGNQAGIPPNLIQTFQVLARINQFDNQADGRSASEQDNGFAQFSGRQRAKVYESIAQIPTIPNYKRSMLADRRALILRLGRALNKRFKSSVEMRIVLTENAKYSAGYLQYPALIIERQGYTTKAKLAEFMTDLARAFHAVTPISFANRPSFGFASPSIGDLGASMRIWPGLIPGDMFERIVIQAMNRLGYLKPAPPSAPPAQFSDTSPLQMALQQAIQRARSRNGADRVQPDSDYWIETEKWVDDRVTSNLIKAKELLRLLATSETRTDTVVLRAIRTLENINEYEVLQAALQETGVSKRDALRRKTELLETYERHVKRNYSGNDTWTVLSAKLMSSGMAAYRSVASLTGKPRKSNRAYFEISKLTTALEDNIHLVDEDIAALPMVILMQDLSYNFVSGAQLQSRPKVAWNDVPESTPQIAIFDTTNTTVEEALAAVPDPADFVVMFESLSKHFQFGADKTTLGRVIIFKKREPRRMPQLSTLSLQEMEQRFSALQHTVLPNGFLNYILEQQEVFGDKIIAPPPVFAPPIIDDVPPIGMLPTAEQLFANQLAALDELDYSLFGVPILPQQPPSSQSEIIILDNGDASGRQNDSDDELDFTIQADEEEEFGLPRSQSSILPTTSPLDLQEQLRLQPLSRQPSSTIDLLSLLEDSRSSQPSSRSTRVSALPTVPTPTLESSFQLAPQQPLVSAGDDDIVMTSQSAQNDPNLVDFDF